MEKTLFQQTIKPALNKRFGIMAALARRKCGANLEVCRPQEVQWKPPLRQAAGTLWASFLAQYFRIQERQ
jgi:hypothetical protein